MTVKLIICLEAVLHSRSAPDNFGLAMFVLPEVKQFDGGRSDRNIFHG